MPQSKTIHNDKLKSADPGILKFAEDLKTQGADVVQVHWKPSAGGDQDMLRLLEKPGS